MKNIGENNLFSSNGYQQGNNSSNFNTYYTNLLLYFQYLSNTNNSKYENGGIKNKIPIEHLLLGLGPFILTTNINILNIPYVDYNLNIRTFSEFLIYIMNNPEINYGDNNMNYINRLFLESIKSGNGYLSKIEKIQGCIGWNLNILYELFKKDVNALDKKQILISFDNKNFKINIKKKFDLFCEIMTTFNFFGEKNENIQSFYNDFLFIKWENFENQISLINLMITNKEISENSIFSLNNYQGQKISKDIELKAYTSSKNHFLIDNWRNVKLVETLVIISEEFDNYAKVKELFDWAIKNIPEIIIMSLLIIKIDYTKNSLMNDLIIEILNYILFDKNPRVKLVNDIWQKNKDIVIYVLYNSWKNYPDLMNLSLIFDLANNVIKDSLLSLVNCKYHDFSVHLGLLASKRDYLHIEKWLKKNINEYGDEFINYLLDYLTNNVIKPCQINFNSGLSLDEINKANILEKAQLSLESLGIILNTLNSYTNTNENSDISLQTKEEIVELNKLINDIYDTYDEIQEQQLNSKEIEDEISDYLRSLFEGKITTDNIINLLIVYKSSKDKKKVELFSCLIHQLIVEYKNFIRYPKDKLKLLAELFGKIVNNKLLEGVIETLALNYISDSIKSGNENLYYFGVIALTQIIENISCWPRYVKILLDIEQIRQNKDLYMKILKENEKIKKHISNISHNGDKQNGKILSIKSENKSSDIEFEDNGKVHLDNNINENVDKLKHKLSGTAKSFILNEINTDNNNITIATNTDDNNLLLEKIVYNAKLILESNTQSNILEKVSEINKFLNNDEINIKIFSYILVTSKIIHSKNVLYYNELLSKINNTILNKFVLKYTIKYIQVLLSLKSINIEEKNFNILKNLGYWLGIISILKNKPILARDIDFRELITESYIKDKLTITIPFVCKVFAHISKSKVFTINNPWINSILCLLKEIYFMHSLNQSIKKDIQTFFESVKIDINSMKISIEYLKNIKKEEKSDKRLDFPKRYQLYINIEKNKLEKKIGTLNDFINNLLNILNSDKSNIPNSFIIRNTELFDMKSLRKINEIINKIMDSEKKFLEDKKDMIICLSNLLIQSIEDTLPNMMEVYFSFPIEGAIAIVNQDFFYEFDINKYKAALNNTIKSLLSSYSIISFHDMLKRNIGVNLEIWLKSHNLSKEVITNIKELPNNDYLNIGLQEILKFIIKEAQNKLNSNEAFRIEIERRKNINNFKLLFNSNNYDVKVRNVLPPKLRPNNEGLRNEELEIYEKFQVNNNVLKMYEEDGRISNFLNIVYRILKEVMDKTWEGNTSMKVSKYKNYELCMKNIINICNKKEFDFRINFLDEDQHISFNFLKKIATDCKIDKVDVINKMAMKTFDCVFIAAKMDNLLLLSVFMYILRGWCKLNADVVNQITKRLFEYDFNVDIFTLFKYELHQFLFKLKLINFDIYQEYMMNILNQSSVVNTMVHSLLKAIMSNNIHINQDNNLDFFKKIGPLISNSKLFKIYYSLFNKKTSILIDMAKNYNALYKKDENIINSSFTENDNMDSKDKKELNNLYISFFIKTTKLGENLIFYGENKMSQEENKIENMFSENDILKYTGQICDICLNNSLDCKFKKYAYFFYPEKFSIFIYYLIYYKNISLLRILDIIINCFHRDYVSNKQNFNQKKYYRFFINLINLIAKKNISETNNDNINNLILICDTLRILSPKNYPGFSLAWLDLISYHNFINNFLDKNLIEENSYKYEKYLSLLIEILTYMNKIKDQIIKNFYYKYILDMIYKFFYLLVNTYPSFISSYHYLLISCLSLSSNLKDEDINLFIQLKNIILSPIIIEQNTPNHNFLTKRLLKDNYIPNKIVYLINNSIDDEENINKEDLQLKILIDKYFKEKKDENILEEILDILDNIKDEKDLNYVYNGLSVYILQYKIINGNNGKIDDKNIIYDFYLFLLCNLNEIHKNHLIDSILNLLRFNSTITIYFCSLFQELLSNLENEDIEKQLVFNLLRRVSCEPKPWGIIYTYSKVIKENDKYKNIEKIYLKGNEKREYFL